MRIIKTGILLFLILKGTLGFSIGVTAATNVCCDTGVMEVVASVEKDIADPEDTKEEDSEKGCCDLSCHCLCCIHILSEVKNPELFINVPQVIEQSLLTYSFSYQHLLLRNIWQPPRRI